MDIGYIATGIMFLLGGFMFFAPEQCTREDKRDDAEAVAKIKKFGIMFMCCAAAAVLYAIKYKFL